VGRLKDPGSSPRLGVEVAFWEATLPRMAAKPGFCDGWRGRWPVRGLLMDNLTEEPWWLLSLPRSLGGLLFPAVPGMEQIREA
jgi:hypothetical protein